MSLRSGNHRTVGAPRLALSPFISWVGRDGAMVVAYPQGDVTSSLS